MIQKIIVIFLTFSMLTACQNNDTANSLNRNKINPTRVKEIKDATVNFQIIDHYAIYTKGSDTICRTYLQPEKKVGDTISGNQYILDEAYMVASCMIVLRGIHYLGDFCHIPSVKKVEIYTQYGDTLYPDAGYLYGNNFTAPSGNWGIINDEAEGDLYAYIHINSKGELKSVSLDENNFHFYGEILDVTVVSDSIIRYNQISSDFRGAKAQLEIYCDGSYKFIYPPLETDSIQFQFFNEFEPVAYKSQPYIVFCQDTITKDYFKKFINPNDYTRDVLEFQLFDFNKLRRDGLFMTTGIKTTSLPFKIILSNKYIDLNEKIELNDNDHIILKGEKTSYYSRQIFKHISLQYYKDGHTYELLNDEALKIGYEGEVPFKIHIKYVTDINNDSFPDFLINIEGDICICNRAVVSNLEDSLIYKIVHRDDVCWD